MAKTTEAPMPWERQEGETPKQFEAFKLYRDMGEDRGVQKVADALSKSRTLMTRWKSANKWDERCVAWDRERDRIARQEQIKDIKKMRKRHADVANSMIVAAAKGLKSIMAKPEEMKPNDVARLVEVASRLERLSRGDTSEVIEERQGEAVSAVQIYIPDNNRGRDKETFDDLEV